MKNLTQILLLTTILVFSVVTSAFGTLPTPEEQERQCASSAVDYKKAVVLAKAIQDAIRNNDRKMLANLAGYPLRVVKSRHCQSDKVIYYYIRTKKQFMEQYNSIFTKEVISSVLQADPANIFCNYEGAAIAGGTIWFQGGDPLMIVSVIK